LSAAPEGGSLIADNGTRPGHPDRDIAGRVIATGRTG
jgi:hypothetical protein